MILYQLKCDSGHAFEGWFRNSAAFDEQLAAGDLNCPACGDTRIAKAPMAPAVSRARPTVNPVQMLREIRRHVEANCENVGNNFAEEARKIHYGEAESRGIYGDTTPEEAAALTEEGIEFRRIPWAPATDS